LFSITSKTGGVSELGGATPQVTYGQFFSSNDHVDDIGTTLNFTSDGAANRTRGAGVWLDTTYWVAGTVTVTFDISGFVAATGDGSGSFFQTYTASGVNGTDAVGVDMKGSFNAGVVLSGTATSGTLGGVTTITGNGTLTYTFDYDGEEEIGLFFVHQATNATGGTTAAFSLDNLRVFAQTTRPDRPAQPNIVILLADDLGWQDVKCYDIYDLGDTDDPLTPGVEGSQSIFVTPYMDALADEGVQFWEAYSPAPTCAPSRGAMMSGKHPARVNRFHVGGGTVPRPHKVSERMMVPHYSGRLPIAETTIPEVLGSLGYYSGHSGKWHIAISHNAYPQPLDHGFDWTKASRGVANGMNDRLAGFATPYDPLDPNYDPNDNFRLDINGFAKDQTTVDALEFLTEAVTGATATQPFFLYYASWLVHAPIQMRTAGLLEKYMLEMGHINTTDADPDNDTFEDVIDNQDFIDELFALGQNNPYYAAMVETFDYNVYQIMEYLKTTPDPRWAGHMLIDNTYIFLTSDNGGKESISGEQVTDNYPLDKGKSYIQEGGTRVPFIIVGHDIPANVESDVMINGLDLFPTIVSLAGGTPTGTLDGCDLTDFLRTDPTDPLLVKDLSGVVRDTMYWHFPETGKFTSTIRKDGWKLFQNYDHVNNVDKDPFDLFELYDSTTGVRVDIEEANDVYATDPDGVATTMTDELNTWLIEVDGGVARYNPNYNGNPALPNQDQVPVLIDNGDNGGIAWVTYETDKTQVVEADLLYTLNGGDVWEEWFKAPATIVSPGRVEATVPEGTTHYLINLIDEYNFLVSSEDVEYEHQGSKGSTYMDAYVYQYLYIGPEIELYHSDFTSETVGTGNGARLERDDSEFKKRSDSAWTIGAGVLSNSDTTADSRISEGAVGRILNISALEDAGFDEITVSFDYTLAGATESLLLHLWGHVDINSVATTQIMYLGANGGKASEETTGENPLLMTAYNLGHDDGSWIDTPGDASDAAATLTGVGTHTYTETFVLSDFTTAPDNLSLYDYLVFGFSRDIGDGSGSPAVTIDNLKITVPNRDGYVVWAYEAGLVDDVITSDPDFDGLNNLLEYGLGGDPEQADSGLLPYFEVNTEATDEWTFTYRRRLDAPAEQLTYTAECKKDLGNDLEAWSSDLITEMGAVAIDATYELVTCTVDVSGGVTSIFLRLAVEQAP